MSYVAVGVLFLLIAAGFITYLVLSATRRSANPDSAGAPQIGADHTPFGDTGEHAGEQSEQGHTVGRTDASSSHDPGVQQDPPDGRFKRDPVGGEAEAEPSMPADSPRR